MMALACSSDPSVAPVMAEPTAPQPSIAKPSMVSSSTIPVAHLRNCTARSELTL